MITKFKIFDKNYYEETSWTMQVDGEDVTINIHQIQDYLKYEPVIEIPVQEIENLCVHKNKKNKKTLKRSQESDLSFPIIISKNSNSDYNMILDGNHRLKKAIDNKIKYIKAKVLNLKDAPSDFKKMFDFEKIN